MKKLNEVLSATVLTFLLSSIQINAGDVLYWTDLPLTERNCMVHPESGFHYVNNSYAITQYINKGAETNYEWITNDAFSKETCEALLGEKKEGYFLFSLEFKVERYSGEVCSLKMADNEPVKKECPDGEFLNSATCECQSDPCKELGENTYRSNADESTCNQANEQLNGYITSDGVVTQVYWDMECQMCKVQFQTCPEYTKPNSEGVCVALPNNLAGDNYCPDGYFNTKAMFRAGLSYGELKPNTCYTTYQCTTNSETVKYEQVSCGIVSFDGTDISDGIGTIDTKVHKLTFDSETNASDYDVIGDSVIDHSEYNSDSNYTGNDSTSDTSTISDANTRQIVSELVKINSDLLSKNDIEPLINLNEDIKSGIDDVKEGMEALKKSVGNVSKGIDDVKDAIENLDKSEEALSEGENFGNEVTNTFGTFVLNDLLSIGSVPKSVPNITITLRGQNYTLLSEAMLNDMGFDVNTLRSILIVLAAISGFLSIFRGGE